MIKSTKWFLTFLLIFSSSLDFMIHRADSLVFDLVHQYFQCKNLKMIKTIDPKYGEYYTRDNSIKDNQLDDKFYRGLGLFDYGFDEAMQLVRSIYTETENCTISDQVFCDCVTKMYMTKDGDYSILFRNSTNFSQLKGIIQAFSIAFEAYLRIDNYGQSVSRYTYPTLFNFVVYNDFTKDRLIKSYNLPCLPHRNEMVILVFLSGHYKTSDIKIFQLIGSIQVSI